MSEKISLDSSGVKSIIYDRYEKINSAFALLGVGDRRV